MRLDKLQHEVARMRMELAKREDELARAAAEDAARNEPSSIRMMNVLVMMPEVR